MLKAGTNKYHSDNTSSENIEEILRLFYKESDYENKAFARLMNDASTQIDETKLCDGCYEILLSLQQQEDAAE